MLELELKIFFFFNKNLCLHFICDKLLTVENKMNSNELIEILR